VVKTSLKLLLVFVEYTETNTVLLLKAVKGVDKKRGAYSDHGQQLMNSDLGQQLMYSDLGQQLMYSDLGQQLMYSDLGQQLKNFWGKILRFVFLQLIC
jgi:hypothetical protein